MGVDTVLVLLVLLAITAATRLFDGTFISPPIILSTSLLIPVLAFEIELKSATLVLLAGSALGFAVAYWLVVVCSKASVQVAEEAGPADEKICKEIEFVTWFFFLIAQFAFLVNLGRVISVFGPGAYLSASSKMIELTFGASTLINYMFFLNIVTAAAAAFMVASKSGSGWMRVIWAISIAALAFSGIKSTVLFGGAISLFAYIIGKPRLSMMAIMTMALAGLTIVVSMFVFVNIGVDSNGVGAISTLAPELVRLAEGYIEYNYLNFDKEVAERTSFTLGKYTFFFLTKLFDPEIKGYFDSTDFLLIDKNFNMGTYLREYYVDFGAFGALGIPALLGLISGGVRAWVSRSSTVPAVLTLSVLLTACMFAFFGNQFVRLQFIYVILSGLALQAIASLVASVASTATKVGR